MSGACVVQVHVRQSVAAGLAVFNGDRWHHHRSPVWLREWGGMMKQRRKAAAALVLLLPMLAGSLPIPNATTKGEVSSATDSLVKLAAQIQCPGANIPMPCPNRWAAGLLGSQRFYCWVASSLALPAGASCLEPLLSFPLLAWLPGCLAACPSARPSVRPPNPPRCPHPSAGA